MITDFDDYPIHQTHLPIEATATTDRNFYDRYFFSGFDRDADFLFEIGLGLYPNRYVLDGHFSVSLGGKQHAFHASRRAPKERAETVVQGRLSQIRDASLRRSYLGSHGVRAIRSGRS